MIMRLDFSSELVSLASSQVFGKIQPVDEILCVDERMVTPLGNRKVVCTCINSHCYLLNIGDDTTEL